MKRLLLASSLALAITTAFPGSPLLSTAHASASAPAATLSSNRFGLPDFGDLVTEVGPAVVNIAVVQRRAAPNAENPFANDPFYDFLRRFGVPVPGMPGQGSGPRVNRGIGSGFIHARAGRRESWPI